MNLHALRIFSKVAALQSVTKASEVLMISQPAVTIQIRNLEKEIGLPLIESKGRGIILTQYGEVLYAESTRLFALEERIETKISELKNGHFDELRISSTLLPANFLLPKWLAIYKKEFQQVHIQLQTGNSTEVIEQLLNYKVDIAFIVKEDGNNPEVQYTHLMNTDYWFIVPYEHKYANQEVTMDDLMKEPFIFREEGSSTRDLLLSLCKTHKVAPPSLSLQFHGLNESIRAIAAGYGTMLAPSIAVQEYINMKQVAKVKVKEIHLQRPIYLCTRKYDSILNDYCKAFIQLINSMSN